MTEPSPPGLSDLCAALPHLKRDAARSGQHAQLRQSLQTLHTILARDDTPARAADVADAIARIWRAYGLPATPRSWRPDTQLPGPQAAAPVIGAYSCPRRQCDREEKRAPGGAVPLCPFYDNEPLAFEGRP
ncbi:hypothetical protein [Streptomyces sp. NPDC057623]|uniref:hypothetical protein n=1 Tax=Streptomyces sp. NPDC057623 TaxID=3346187 RepID=UPI00368DDF7F